MKQIIRNLCSPFIALILLASCSKTTSEITNSNNEEVVTASGSNNPGSRQGYVYTESNDAGTNKILFYKQNSNGTLESSGETASGGNGLGAVLGSQSALQISDDGKWLFAVNAGSNSISSFSLGTDGKPVLVSTVSSNGSLPVSITVYGNYLYVVNSTTANISGFTIEANGSLTLLSGSTQSLSASNAKPAQISFNPNGQLLIVTERATNKITTFPVNNGIAGAAVSISSHSATPSGFGFAGNNLIVSNGGNGELYASTVSSYSGTMSLVSGPVQTNQTDASWVQVTKDGKYAYVANSGINSISLLKIASDGTLTLVDGQTAFADAGPTDISLSKNEFYLYALNHLGQSISFFKKGSNSSLQNMGKIKGLPAYAAGLVAL